MAESDMAGKIIQQINEIIEGVSKKDPILVRTTRTKLILKGINPDKYDRSSADDPAVSEKLIKIAAEFGLTIH
jgi:hypothetical protein